MNELRKLLFEFIMTGRPFICGLFDGYNFEGYFEAVINNNLAYWPKQCHKGSTYKA